MTKFPRSPRALPGVLFALAFSLLLPALAPAAENKPFPKLDLETGDQILFLGDSITQSGRYIAFIELYLWDQYPDHDFDITNLGLGAETASGDSEPTHEYPRPVIHERLGRIQKATDPDAVFFCYGMNDGIYHPFSTERFAHYRDGMSKLFDAYDCQRVFMTTTPFHLPSARLRGTPNPNSGPEYPYTYQNFFAGYDEVLHRYGAWVKSQNDKAAAVVDLHTPLWAYIRSQTAIDPDYKFGDGVHPPTEGHLVMALAILEALGEDKQKAEDRLFELTGIRPVLQEGETNKPTQLWKDVAARENLLSAAWREHIGHTKPQKSKALPLEEAQQKAAEMEKAIRARLSQPAAIAQ